MTSPESKAREITEKVMFYLLSKRVGTNRVSADDESCIEASSFQEFVLGCQCSWDGFLEENTTLINKIKELRGRTTTSAEERDQLEGELTGNEDELCERINDHLCKVFSILDCLHSDHLYEIQDLVMEIIFGSVL